MRPLRIVSLTAFVCIAVSCGRDAVDPLENAIEEIEAGRVTTPLIEQTAPGSGATVTFLVESPGGPAPRIVSDVTGWGESPDDSFFDLTIGTMARVGATDWYSLETRVAPGARIEYLVVNGEADYRVDPHNPRRAWSRGGHDISEFVMPDWAPPPELTDSATVPLGITVEGTIDSHALGKPRRAIVYLPPEFRDDGAHPVAVFHGGWGVARDGQVPRVLDWLITHGKIEPVVGLFLESWLPGESNNYEGQPLRSFLTEEAPAWLTSRFAGTAPAERWAVLAISYGAKDAVDAALSPIQAYGGVGLLIPGRRLTSADLEAFAAQPGRRLRVAILAGLYDQANIGTARAAREFLADAGHTVDLIEVPEGHNPATWRNHLGDVLVSLFGNRTIEESPTHSKRSSHPIVP